MSQLIACALGCIAKPYDTMVTSPSETSTASSVESQGEDLEMVSAYFELARQRLGLLDQSLLAAQCHFFAGVYYMFTLAPLRAWSQFEHAANTFYIYWTYLSHQDSQPQTPWNYRTESVSVRDKLAKNTLNTYLYLKGGPVRIAAPAAHTWK